MHRPDILIAGCLASFQSNEFQAKVLVFSREIYLLKRSNRASISHEFIRLKRSIITVNDEPKVNLV